MSSSGRWLDQPFLRSHAAPDAADGSVDLALFLKRDLLGVPEHPDPADLLCDNVPAMRQLAAFCGRWGVEELALFGSVLRDDFGPDSDIDVLVRFKLGRTPGLFVAARIRSELADMCRRRVDLVHRPTIERSRNYVRRKKILESARVVHAT